MNVLMLSTDANILVPQSGVSKRMIAYGKNFTKLTIIVLGVGERTVLDLSEEVHVVFPGGRDKRDAYKNSFWESMREGRSLPAAVVSTQDPFFVGFVGWRVATALHVPLQSQLHTDVYSSGYMFSSIRHFFEACIAFFVLRNSSCVRVVSNRIMRSLWFVQNKRIQVLPITTAFGLGHTSSAQPSEFVDGTRIIMVSRLEPEKRIHLAIDALVDLPSSVHLYIVGTGSLESALKKRAEKNNIVERVHFLGWKESIAQYFEHADIFLQLSRYEGYGRSLVEAGLAACASISTDVGVVGDVFVHDTSVYVTKANRKAVTHAITALLENTDLRTRLGIGAKDAAEAHILSEESYMTRYRELLEQCVS